MKAIWYYAVGGVKNGPVLRDQVELALRRGEIDGRALVWRQGMEQWQMLETVDELRPLLDDLAPPVPPLPPPVVGVETVTLPGVTSPPPPPPPASSGEIATAETVIVPRADGGKPSRSEKRKTLLLGWAQSSFEWLARRTADTQFGKQLSRKRLLVVLITIIAGTTVWVVATDDDTQRAAGPHGTVLIDANPWGEMDWIRREGGGRVEVAPGSTTPLVMALPVGTYQAQVFYPPSKASRQCRFQVQEGGAARCWLELEPTDAQDYLKTIGW